MVREEAELGMCSTGEDQEDAAQEPEQQKEVGEQVEELQPVSSAPVDEQVEELQPVSPAPVDEQVEELQPVSSAPVARRVRQEQREHEEALQRGHEETGNFRSCHQDWPPTP